MTAAVFDAPAAPRGFRAWAARRPVTAFHVLLFGLGYPIMALPILAHRGVLPGGDLPARIGLDTERAAALLMTLGVMLPAVLWVTWAAEGRDGLRALGARMVRWRIGAVWWAVVLAGLPLLTLAIARLLGATPRTIDDPAAWAVGQLGGLLAGFLIINLWEESSWAGFVQTRLERRHSLGVAALLTAVPFALIHMPLQMIGPFTLGSLGIAFALILLIGSMVRLLIGVFLRATGDSLLAAGLLHSVFNRSNNNDGLVASLVEGDERQMAAFLATIALLVAVAAVKRRRLGRAARLELDARRGA